MPYQPSSSPGSLAARWRGLTTSLVKPPLCYNTHVGTPISALQRNAAHVVRRVAASGVAEEITDRGRVVAILAPPPRTEGLERLRQAGAVRPAKPGRLYEVVKRMGRVPEIGLTEALKEQRDTDR